MQPNQPAIQVQHGNHGGGNHFDRSMDDFVAGDVRTTTILDDLRAELAQDPEVEDTIVRVPMRPNISLVFAKEIDWDIVKEARKRAGAKGEDTKNFDQMRFIISIMSHASKDLLLNGRSTETKLNSPVFHEMMGVMAGQTRAAIEKLFKLNGHVIIAGGEVLREAGYDPESLDVMTDSDETPLAE